MEMREIHLTDEELLLALDGELPAHRTSQVQQHLLSCWECRARRSRIEAAIASFVDLHHATLDPQVGPAEGPRALLRSRMAAAQASTTQHWWQRWRLPLLPHRFAYLSPLLAAFLVAMALWRHPVHIRTDITQSLAPPVPNPHLTPGAVRAVQLQDVCMPVAYEQARITSLPLKEQVFREYGMTGATMSNYEVDFLITPELGGTDDVHNLWPEPYGSTEWNAHVKDELEDRLHDLVCARKIDLETAQRDIATNWIAAYKKYFHTNKPITSGSDL